MRAYAAIRLIEFPDFTDVHREARNSECVRRAFAVFNVPVFARRRLSGERKHALRRSLKRRDRTRIAREERRLAFVDRLNDEAEMAALDRDLGVDTTIEDYQQELAARAIQADLDEMWWEQNYGD